MTHRIVWRICGFWVWPSLRMSTNVWWASVMVSLTKTKKIWPLCLPAVVVFLGHMTGLYGHAINTNCLSYVCCCVTSWRSQEAYKFVTQRVLHRPSQSGQLGLCGHETSHKSTALQGVLARGAEAPLRHPHTTDNWIYWAEVYQSVNAKPPDPPFPSAPVRRSLVMTEP